MICKPKYTTWMANNETSCQVSFSYKKDNSTRLMEPLQTRRVPDRDLETSKPRIHHITLYSLVPHLDFLLLHLRHTRNQSAKPPMKVKSRSPHCTDCFDRTGWQSRGGNIILTRSLELKLVRSWSKARRSLYFSVWLSLNKFIDVLTDTCNRHSQLES